MRILFFLALLAFAAPARAEDCLARAASRYLHETERNFDRTFDLAEQSDVVLRSDEADALFERARYGSAAHGRYANQEVGYLMERLQRYEHIEPLTSLARRALIAGFRDRERSPGIILMQIPTGVRVIEFNSADRMRALEYARATLQLCPPYR